MQFAILKKKKYGHLNSNEYKLDKIQLIFMILKNRILEAWLVAQLVGASSNAPEGCRFDSRSEHMWEATNCVTLSWEVSLPHSLHHSLKINKHILG